MKIFVSYSRSGKPQVLEIVQALKIHDAWLDDRLNVGQEWWEEIEGQIAACHCFMYILSPESIASEYCQKEWAIARRLEKQIAPVLLKAADIPRELSKLQIIDTTKGFTSDTSVNLLNGLFEIERIVFNPLKSSGVKSSANNGAFSISDLTFVTTSSQKLSEYEAILGVKLQANSLYFEEIQHLEVGEVAISKLERAYSVLKKPVFVEQSGIVVRAWGGLPGGITTTFIKTLGLNNFCKMLNQFDDRYAEIVSVIAFTDGQLTRKFLGTLRGEIAQQPKGENLTFGKIFIPEGFDKTCGEMSNEEYTSISNRRRVVVEFMRFLQANYRII